MATVPSNRALPRPACPRGTPPTQAEASTMAGTPLMRSTSSLRRSSPLALPPQGPPPSLTSQRSHRSVYPVLCVCVGVQMPTWGQRQSDNEWQPSGANREARYCVLNQPWYLRSSHWPRLARARSPPPRAGSLGRRCSRYAPRAVHCEHG
jgi:hypothetical protein